MKFADFVGKMNNHLEDSPKNSIFAPLLGKILGNSGRSAVR